MPPTEVTEQPGKEGHGRRLKVLRSSHSVPGGGASSGKGVMVNVERLHSRSEGELMRFRRAQVRNPVAHYNMYLDDRALREAKALTKSIKRLTWAIAVATCIGVGLIVRR